MSDNKFYPVRITETNEYLRRLGAVWVMAWVMDRGILFHTNLLLLLRYAMCHIHCLTNSTATNINWRPVNSFVQCVCFLL